MERLFQKNEDRDHQQSFRRTAVRKFILPLLAALLIFYVFVCILYLSYSIHTEKEKLDSYSRYRVKTLQHEYSEAWKVNNNQDLIFEKLSIMKEVLAKEQETTPLLLILDHQLELVYTIQEPELLRQEYEAVKKKKPEIDRSTTVITEQGQKYLIYYDELDSEGNYYVALGWNLQDIYSQCFREAISQYMAIGVVLTAAILIMIGLFNLQFIRYFREEYMDGKTAEDILERMMNASEFSILLMDEQFNIKKASKGTAEVFCGMPQESYRGKNLFSLAEMEKAEKMCRKYVAEGGRNSGIFSIYNSARCQNEWVYLDLQRISSRNGEKQLFLSMLKLTENIMASRIIDSIMEGSENSMLVLGGHNEILFASRKAAEHLHIADRANLQKKTLEVLNMVRLNQITIQQLMERASREGKINEAMMIEYLDFEQEPWWAQVMCSELYAMNEKAGYLLIFTDITHYLQKQEEALKMARQKESMLLAISHGIRNPLNILTGTLELQLVRESAPAQRKLELLHMREAADDIAEMVSDVVGYMDIDKEKPEDEVFVVSEFISSLRLAAHALAKKEKLLIFGFTDEKLEDRQSGCQRYLSQIVNNLLEYLYYYMAEGVILFKISIQQDMLTFTLCGIGLHQDEGILPADKDGELEISENMLSGRTFSSDAAITMNFKYEVSRDLLSRLGRKLVFRKEEEGIAIEFAIPYQPLGTQKAFGTLPKLTVGLISINQDIIRYFNELLLRIGIKCSIYHSIDEVAAEKKPLQVLFTDSFFSMSLQERPELKHIQTITLVKTYEEALRFTSRQQIVYLQPWGMQSLIILLQGQITAGIKAAEARFIFHTEGVRVLVVDDSEVNRMIEKNLLELYDIKVDQADSGRQALNCVPLSDYDIIFMDHIMPEMDGVEATQEIKKLPGADKVIIVALSANLVAATISKFYEAGADDVMTKPIELERLSQCLKKWLAADKIREEYQAGDSREEKNLLQGLLHSAGREEQYLGILDSSIRMFQAAVGCLQPERAAAEEERKRTCHNLKGLLPTVGAKQLGMKFARLESAEQADDRLLQEAVRELEIFCSELQRQYEELKAKMSLLQEQQSLQESCSELSREEELVKREKLARYLERFEYDAILQCLDELILGSRGAKRDELQLLREAAREFRYEEVMEYLENSK